MRLREIAIAVDQLANAVLGGYAAETMSSRCWRLREFRPYRFLRPLIDGLFFWQPEHCRSCYEALVARRNMPNEYQQ
jgi:hypothetical protein